VPDHLRDLFSEPACHPSMSALMAVRYTRPAVSSHAEDHLDDADSAKAPNWIICPPPNARPASATRAPIPRSGAACWPAKQAENVAELRQPREAGRLAGGSLLAAGALAAGV
jgi:hypothetical protein